MTYDLMVIGGGAAGCFAAIRLAELHRGAKICILEAARKPLGKVEISGGGRCNVTHACFEPEALVKFYPRGEKELLEPFQRFQPKDLVDWFSKKGVRIKKEPDGRMFPESDDSATIINCFLQAIRKSNIELLTSTRAVDWSHNQGEKLWRVKVMDGRELQSRFLLITAGSDQRTWDMLKKAGHTVIFPVPSLFTFQIRDKELIALQGISKANVVLSIPQFDLRASGPLLITHWGLSGPAVLRLSAWGARELYRCGYVFDLMVNWMVDVSTDQVVNQLKLLCDQNPKKQIHNLVLGDFPARLWKYLCLKSGIPDKVNGSEIGKARLDTLSITLTQDTYRVTGKSTFKEEFVTAGGVELSEIDFSKFESRKMPGLFLAGEVLNIDALTGGFNFQAAWTGAEIVAQAVRRSL